MQPSAGVPGRQTITDRTTVTASGYPFIAAALLSLAAAAYAGLHAFGMGQHGPSVSLAWLGGCFALVVIGIVLLAGLYVVQPVQSAVIVLFGSYLGTETQEGVRWTNPLAGTKIVSRRTNSLETSILKVNDGNGTPIEVAAAVMWHVEDAARAALQVEDYREYVKVQAEASVRAMANTHPYDYHDELSEGDAASPAPAANADRPASLLAGGEAITNDLKRELSDRLSLAGIVIDEARITHLAYAPEIAPAMLRRQQAATVVSSRRTIVRGAVGIVAETIDMLKAKGIEIDEDRRAPMVASLLVVLVAEKEATPVLPTGSVYG